MGNFDHLNRLPKDEFNYFHAYENEKTLYSKLTAEMINHRGVLCEFYVVSYDTTYDRLFGEDDNRRVERKFQFMSIFELPKEEEQWSFFNIMGLDTFSIFVSKLSFNNISQMEKPRVGDFVSTRYNRDMLYEITDIRDGELDNRFLQFNHLWELVVKKYENTHVDDENGLLPTGTADNTDIFDTSMFVDLMKQSTETVPTQYPDVGKGHPNPLYDPDPDEQAPNDPFGGF